MRVLVLGLALVLALLCLLAIPASASAQCAGGACVISYGVSSALPGYALPAIASPAALPQPVAGCLPGQPCSLQSYAVPACSTESSYSYSYSHSSSCHGPPPRAGLFRGFGRAVLGPFRIGWHGCR
jgi:hypothetical protein